MHGIFQEWISDVLCLQKSCYSNVCNKNIDFNQVLKHLYES